MESAKFCFSSLKSRRQTKSSGSKRIEQINELLDGSLSRFAGFALTISTHRFLRFFASRRSSLNNFGTTWSVTPPVSLLSCYIPLQCTWLTIFRTTCSAFPTKTSKYAKYRIIVFSNWRHIRPSTYAPLNSVANQNGGNLTHFDGA